jgi:5-methyltetrahydrofolate--homocysteine methyltransferase
VLIIGEKINTINPRVRRAVDEHDTRFIRDLAVAQAKAGVDVIDVNVGGHPGEEPDNMRWAVEVIQEAVDLPLSIDSAHPETVRVGLQACRNRQQVWANSITLEKARLDGILPSVAEYGCWVAGLCMDEGGVPTTAAERLEMANRLVDEVERRGVSRGRLYLDALIEPISVKPMAALVSLETIRAIRSGLPGLKTVICLSAISFGLPVRRLLNRTYLPLLLHADVDAIFLDPLDSRLMAALKAAQALLGRDAHGLEYIDAYRSKQLE